jgi:acyl-CoA dehydrogenase
MRRDWPATAVAYEQTVTAAIRDLGGVDVTRAVEAEPARRRLVVPPLLDQLGLAELDPWADEDESAAAMLGVRAAGAAVLPWPLAHALAVPSPLRHQIDGAYLTMGQPRRLDHLDLFQNAIAIDVGKRSATPVTAGAGQRAPLDPFATEAIARPAPLDPDIDVDQIVAMHVLLDAFWVAGALTTVVDLATSHAQGREQFGRPIGTFGEVRWRIADIAVARDGLDELARYTWWLVRQRAATDADVFALRVQMLEAAGVVLANGHQVLGAMGLCEEHDVAVIDRHLQPVLHRPAGRVASTDLFADAVARLGFDSIYPVPPRRPPDSVSGTAYVP